MNNIYLFTWAALGLVVGSLALYRLRVGAHQDNILHLNQAQAGITSAQLQIWRRIHTVDKWGILLTVVLVVYGLVLGGIYLHGQWIRPYQIP